MYQVLANRPDGTRLRSRASMEEVTLIGRWCHLIESRIKTLTLETVKRLHDMGHANVHIGC